MSLMRGALGESYDATLYEDLIPAILAHVATGADLVSDVLRELERVVEGPSPETLSRIERDRDAALARYRRDRDTVTLDATMKRLDAEAEQAKLVRRPLPTADEARRFLADLPYLWAAADPDKRQMLARALFERIDVLGVEQVQVHPTPEALEHGWLTAWQGQTLVVPLNQQSVRYGRGERTRPDVNPRLIATVICT